MRLQTRGKRGVCKLTLNEGKFVKAHILPRGLTKPELNGKKLLQIESGVAITNRSDSWYDLELVSEEGEKLLSDLDDFAIKELRRIGIVWSSIFPIGRNQLPVGERTTHLPGAVQLALSDEARLRQFFVSLIWRSAASSLPDMADVILPEEDLEKLRLEVVGSAPIDPFFYPISLLHYCTTGPRHNLTPFVRFTNSRPPLNYYLRIEIDGLVVLAFPAATRSSFSFSDCYDVVGYAGDLMVLSIPFQKSFGEENLHAAIREHYGS